MQWQGISEFVAVAETGSFTLAAKHLSVSTAQISRQVNQLEKRLSVKLFYRTTRQVKLTDIGQNYFEQCQAILEQLKEAELSVTNLNHSLQGQLKISVPIAYGESHIAPLINDFCLLYPDLNIELWLTNQLVDLTEEKVDLAIRLGALDDSSMMAKKLRPRQQYLCASPKYLRQHGQPESLNDLKHHNCLVGTLDYWRFHNRKLTVNGSLKCNNGYALLDAALKGIGIVQLPDYYVESYLESGQLVSVLPHIQTKNDGVWAVYPHNHHLSTKVRLLLDYLDQHLT
ncbi:MULTISPECIES: LysR substrate-binding domain-containing protein [Vibrio]|uniref:LysR family transcriptional regulator n=1 Tax=Vibrio casei TaxID=673372 RepID=A0A368LL88_9VIBR|nr:MULTISPECIES: LysR substrate-binding domain-containing protein [Vibrio]RCS72670.1 LysR family transcriptional regulator [Vibrio casei]SJN23451.1 Transcriptional regulator, LysR family, in formaldehyde detoxification operon [Vibrio casei]HBV75658.1 LysR family transcriptional regulator [Vibrio sp.]